MRQWLDDSQRPAAPAGSDVLSMTSRSKNVNCNIGEKSENVKSVQRLSIVRWFIVAGGNIDKSNNEHIYEQ